MQNIQKKVSFYTLGCKLNYAETSTISRKFTEEGYQRVDFNEPANIVVINTCSVTQQADKKCRQAINKASRISPGAIVVIIGCYSQLKPDEISRIKGVNLILGAKDKFNIINVLKNIEKSPNLQPSVYRCDINFIDEFNPSYSLFDRTRSFLKIQDGCNYHCSFCTIPLARGASRSNNIQKTLTAARKIAAEGIKEVVITGVNIGDFGQSTNESFFELIQELDKIEDIERFRISSIEPNLLTDEIIRFVANSIHFVPHFHIPLQSGCNKILQLMSRRYTSELFLDRVKTIKSVMPHACIGVDIIAGFPGENDEEFKTTQIFLENLDISYLHVFSYSERKNTRAALLPEKIPQNTRNTRSKILIALSEKKRKKFYSDNIGRIEIVLFESSHEGKLYGYTSNYIKIESLGNKELINKTMRVKLLDLLPSGNMSCICDEVMR